MSKHRWNLDNGPLRGMYRDTENGWIFGVCSGLADFANFRTGTVRLITTICLILFFWPTVLAYLAATLLFRERPLIYSGRDAEYKFWRRRPGSDRWSHS